MTTYRKCENINTDVLEGEYILFKESGDRICFLNKMAYNIWEMCTGLSLDGILLGIAQKVDLSSVSPEEVRCDTEKIIEEFLNNNLICMSKNENL